METINKLLIGLVALALLVCFAISYLFINSNKNKDVIDSSKERVVNIQPPPHPYNVCIKIFIDQSNKQGGECDFDKAKSVCFELIKQNK